jgi:hypothetical protein
VSLLPTCAWPMLAAEFLRAKDDSDRLKVFTNTLLGEPWSEEVDGRDESAPPASAPTMRPPARKSKSQRPACGSCQRQRRCK